MTSFTELGDRGPLPRDRDSNEMNTTVMTTTNDQLPKKKIHKQNSKGYEASNHSYLEKKSSNDDYYTLLAQYIQLKAEKQTLDDYNKRLISMNTYKDEYASKLLKAIEELKIQSCSQNRNSRTVSNEDVVLSQDQYLKLCEKMKKKTEEIKRLNNDLEKCKSDVEVLKMQIRAYKDDWEAERREKVEVENRELKLQEKVYHLEQKLQQQLTEKECASQRTSSYSEPIIRNHHSSSRSYRPDTTTVIPRIYRSKLPSTDLTCDGPEFTKPSTSTASVPFQEISHDKSKDLQCPECGKLFPKHVHLHFLEHFENCHRRKIV